MRTGTRFTRTLVLLATLGAAACGPSGPELILATTTSVQDTGLLDALLPGFSEKTGIRVRVIAVGTGAALRMGAEGNADLLLTHAPSSEQELVDSGVLGERQPFMENHFVIAGPGDDPAGVAQAASASEALRRIHDSGAAYVSRGDDSGTHEREVFLLETAGLSKDGGWPGFASTGAGMGLSLQVAGERGAYILSDIGTFLAFRERIGLSVLSKPEPALRNEYALMLVPPARFPGRIHAEQAQTLVDYLLSPDAQRAIGEFGVAEFGRPLFTPLLATR